MGGGGVAMLGEQGPDRAMIHVWALYALLFQLGLWIWGAVVVALIFLAGSPMISFAILLVSILIGATTSYAWAFLYHGFYHWQFVDEQMHIWRGILFRRRITIPYMRVQNATVARGPLLMLFGLSDVVVETAAVGPVAYGLSARTGAILSGVRDGDRLADAVIEAAKRAKGREGL